MYIKTISSISISDFWDGVRIHDVALRQGDLDGACGPYALMMALLLSRGLTMAQARKIWSGDADGRSKFSKWAKQFDVLMTKGSGDDELHRLFKAVQSLIDTKKIKQLQMTALRLEDTQTGGKGLSSLELIRRHIDQHDLPAIVMLDWKKDSAHWVVALGYQVRVKAGKAELANILTLDPSESTGKIAAWNGVLGLGPLEAKRLRYSTESGEPRLCSASQMIGIVASDFVA